MNKIIILIISAILFTSCSIKTPKNEWQYKSANAYNSYVKNFLSANELLADNDLSRAIKHAKQSANLTHLAKIYLGECALRISVGEQKSCEKYKEISSLVKSKELDSYYNFITLNIKTEDIKYLPKHHQSFAYNLNEKNFKEVDKDIRDMKKTTSSLLCGALAKENINNSLREKLIKDASFNGYKKSAIFWLEEILKHSDNQEKNKTIKRKIFILNN